MFALPYRGLKTGELISLVFKTGPKIQTSSGIIIEQPSFLGIDRVTLPTMCFTLSIILFMLICNFLIFYYLKNTSTLAQNGILLTIALLVLGIIAYTIWVSFYLFLAYILLLIGFGILLAAIASHLHAKEHY
ncbi:hypothetical protein CN507_17855 [Bacillus cereus]|nr:hypothetical protein CN507_17855 [Bacillus cereus]